MMNLRVFHPFLTAFVAEKAQQILEDNRLLICHVSKCFSLGVCQKNFAGHAIRHLGNFLLQNVDVRILHVWIQHIDKTGPPQAAFSTFAEHPLKITEENRSHRSDK